jgi:hypothetical protein
LPGRADFEVPAVRSVRLVEVDETFPASARSIEVWLDSRDYDVKLGELLSTGLSQRVLMSDDEGVWDEATRRRAALILSMPFSMIDGAFLLVELYEKQEEGS